MSFMPTSATESEASLLSSALDDADNCYCIFLHIVEGHGLRRKDCIGDIKFSKILLYATLNGIKFEIDGQNTEYATIFNSTCIWECDLSDAKRMKTDNRPVKIECISRYGSNGNVAQKQIGLVLLPLRGVQIVRSLHNFQPKLLWHKLCATAPEYRPNKPEIYLMLIVIKKSLIQNGQLEDLLVKKDTSPTYSNVPMVGTETAGMLQSQNNVYVQLIESQGVIQVGNNPDIDCDTFVVSITLKHLKQVEKLLFDDEQRERSEQNAFIFYYEVLGSSSHVELERQGSDIYPINEKITLTFKTSVKNLRMYFQRIFYIPINLYANGHAVANFRFDCAKYLPMEDVYFDDNEIWKKNGLFHFDRFQKILNSRVKKPLVEFTLSVHRMTRNVKKVNHELVPLRDTFVPMEDDSRAAGDSVVEEKPHVDASESTLLNSHNKQLTEDAGRLDVLERFIKDARSLTKNLNIDEILPSAQSSSTDLIPKQVKDSGINTDHELVLKSIGVNTDPVAQHAPLDTEDLTFKIVEELEAWKSQQMEVFLSELERKETKYLMKLDERWERQRAILQAQLEAKIAECDKINLQLKSAHAELQKKAEKNREKTKIITAATTKDNNESSYEKKFQMLEGEIQRLKAEINRKSIANEIQNRDLELEIKRLESEKGILNERIKQLENQLQNLHKTCYPPEQIKEMIVDLRQQATRFVEIEKAKDFYKEQWTKTTNELHKLKVYIIREQEKKLMESSNDTAIDAEKCLEEILSDEKNALNNDRCELNQIKEMLLLSSESSCCSSSCVSVCDNTSNI